MAAHFAPRPDRRRLVGALSVAAGLALLTVGAIGLGSRGPEGDGAAPAPDVTEPTVLGAVIAPPEASDVEEVALAAAPATFALEASTTTLASTTTDAPSRRRRRSRSTTPTTGPAVIGTPTSVTVPVPPTSTTTAPTTTQAPPTTEAPTTTAVSTP